MAIIEKLKQQNYTSEILSKEPMSKHSSLRLGGPADFFTMPGSAEELVLLLQCCREEGLPYTLLGGGANILVADRGIRGMVIQTSGLSEIQQMENRLMIQAGCDVSRASEYARDHSLQGLEWIYRMPGSLGGALWMNARCYGSEMAEILDSVRVITPQGELEERLFQADQWAYKDSPFQHNGDIIIDATLNLQPGDPQELQVRMSEIAKDRVEKGHFTKPSAGSTFKNNRDFGAPSGKIIDECGLRGLELGDAQVAPWHGNILINRGSATSRDFRSLIEKVQNTVEEKTGFRLEPEVLMLGEWED